MKKIYLLVIILMASLSVYAQKADSRYFELRIYYCNPNRLDALVQRFTNHTTKLFEKHGMENIGYWIPTNNTENALYYVLAFPNKEARDASWKSFVNDPEWKEVAANSEKDGKIIAKITSVFMQVEPDLSPKIKEKIKTPERLFEMRTYTCLPNRLPNLITRFKHHTLKLFKKHGIENIAYWTSIEPDNSQSKLIYFVAHKDEVSAKKSWETFRNNPKWISARDESEKEGKIVEKVESIFMKPTSFSKIK